MNQTNLISYKGELEYLILKIKHGIVGQLFSYIAITKVLTSLHRCAGWSAPLLFECKKVRFSHVKTHLVVAAVVERHAT